jgi:3-oxoacyl-[acyl-carrier-protein] synthase II
LLSTATDVITDTVLQAYKELGVLAGSEPGSNGAHGFALSEGCVALVLERLSHAKSRGARIHGEVLGHGITSDALGIGRIDRHGEGVERAMRLGLERAGVEPGDVTAVWASACGHRVADRAERRAIERVFGDSVEVQTPKVKLGEPMGVGGALGAALALQSWQSGAPAGPVVVNSLSLGGTNFSVVLAPYAS